MIYPVDDAKNDPSFVKFRNRLIKAVKEKDLKILLDSVDEDIKKNLQQDRRYKDIPTSKGIFIKIWDLDSNPNESDIWFVLSEILRLGGIFVKESEKYRGSIRKVFKAPYPIRALWLDSSKHSEGIYSKIEEHYIGIITGKNVNLRSKPSLKGKVIGKLSYNIVRVHYDHFNSKTRSMMNYKYNWHSITTLSGLKGYVYGKYLRRMNDYMANFTKKNGKWVMLWYGIPH